MYHTNKNSTTKQLTNGFSLPSPTASNADTIGARKPYIDTEKVFHRMPTINHKIKITVAVTGRRNWEMRNIWLEVDFVELLLCVLEFVDTKRIITMGVASLNMRKSESSKEKLV